MISTSHSSGDGREDGSRSEPRQNQGNLEGLLPPCDSTRANASVSHSNQDQLQHSRTTASKQRTDQQSSLEKICDWPTVTEFRAVDSYQDLVSLYQRKGMTFKNDEALFEQVEIDWAKELVRLTEKAKTAPFPEEFPSVTVTVDDVDYNIYGCVHVRWANGKRVMDLLKQTIQERSFWAHEQNLGEFISDLRFLSVEIDDHYARGFLAKCILPVTAVREAFNEKGEMPVKRSDVGQEAPLKFRETIANFIHLPFDALSRLPSHIDIIRREHFGEPYNSTQLRSAYMATFLKQWDPHRKQSLRQVVQGGERGRSLLFKNLLVGAGHAHEVEYFLKHAPKCDLKVMEAPAQNAKRLNEDPITFWAGQQAKELVSVAAVCAAVYFTCRGLTMLRGELMHGFDAVRSLFW